MANAVVTPQIFAKLVLMDLGGALNVCRNMSKDVTPEFGKKDYKVGASVDVRKPYRFTVSTGLKYDPQPLTDQVTPVKVAQVAQVSFDWDSVEKTLSIREARELYAKPAALALASTINAACAQYISWNTFNAVGTPGTTPVDEQPYLKAGDLLIEQGLPQDEELNLIVNRKFSSTFVHGVKTAESPGRRCRQSAPARIARRRRSAGLRPRSSGESSAAVWTARRARWWPGSWHTVPWRWWPSPAIGDSESYRPARRPPDNTRRGLPRRSIPPR